MENLNFVSVPVIVAAVVGCLELLKKAVDGNGKVLKFFPLIAAGLGAVLGIIAFFALPEIIPAGNAFVALLIGGSSGLAATGRVPWPTFSRQGKGTLRARPSPGP